MQANAMRACSLIAERSLFYLKILPASGKKIYFHFPSAAISYAMILPASGKKVYFLFPERSYIICKDTAKNLISLNIKPL